MGPAVGGGMWGSGADSSIMSASAAAGATAAAPVVVVVVVVVGADSEAGGGAGRASALRRPSALRPRDVRPVSAVAVLPATEAERASCCTERGYTSGRQSMRSSCDSLLW